MVVLTEAIMNRGKSSNGGWNTEQIRALGVTMQKGWMKRLIGRYVSEKQVEKFISLKDNHLIRKEVKRINSQPKNVEIKQPQITAPSFVHVSHKLTWEQQYQHPNWQKLRLYVLEKHNYTCAECGSQHNTLQVHHMKYVTGKFIWEVPLYSLVALCEICHSKEHGRDLRLKK